MTHETKKPGKSLWLRWVLANVLGLALGLGLFGFFADAAAGEHGTVRSDVGHMAGLTIAGATIGLAPWLVLRRQAERGGGTAMNITLSPVLTFIAVVVLSTAIWGTVAGAVISTSPTNPTEAIPLLVRFVGVLVIGVVAAGLVVRFTLRQPVGLVGWAVLATSITFPVGSIIGIAALGPPVDFFMGVVLVALVGAIFQWLVLRGRMKRAGWWLPANTLGMAIGAAVGLGLAFTFAESVFPVSFLETGLGFVVILALIGTMAGAIGGAISGAALVQLLRQPARGAELAAAPS
jgi:hypothetical protein